MKRLFLLGVFAISFSVALTSCDDGKPHCWEVTCKGTVDGKTESDKFYEYGTADQIDATIKLIKEEAKKENVKNVKVTKKKFNLSENDCWAKNIKN